MDVLIVGGGAAGLMAACVVGRLGKKAVIIERNRFLGVKLCITGKGRCNITNDAPSEALFDSVVQNKKFMYSAFEAFSPKDAMDFFEEIGVPLKTERGRRVFPQSDSAKAVRDALQNEAKRLGTKVLCARVRSVLLQDGEVAGVDTDQGAYHGKRVILSTGGCSYPKTGSSGDGFQIARDLGHRVMEPRPSLVPLIARDADVPLLEGLSLRNVGILVWEKDKAVYKDFGELVFTSNGISGPVALSASAVLTRRKGYPYRFVIDLKPALDMGMLDKRIARDFSESQNRDYQNALGHLLPKKLIPVFVARSGIDPSKKVHSVTKEERLHITRLMKALPFEVTGLCGWDSAIVTSGGVDVKEIDPKTMASKRISGLYFAGEMIDVDAFTGGFNLQIAWSTANAAAKGACFGL